MSDYIKREDAIFVALQQPLYSVVSQIKQLDGIDIVRCKECKSWKSDGGALMCCEISQSLTLEDDYCSFGERREP